MKIDIKGIIVGNDDAWIYDYFDMECVSPKKVNDLISQAKDGEELDIEINSGGGSVFAGSEIYTALKSYKGNTNGRIVGLAASAAGFLAMGVDKLSISPTASIMIHNVSSCACGDYRDLQHEADVISNINKSIANAYSLKTNLGQEELLGMMDDETWLNAQQAKEKGFVDEIMFDEGNKLVASVNNSQMLPNEVINKVKNDLIEKKNQKLKDDNLKNDSLENEKQNKIKNELELAKARLSLRGNL